MSAAQAPDLRPPSPDEIVRWVSRLTGEVARIPVTLYRARLLIRELARLPEQIDELIAALERTSSTLDESLAPMGDNLEELNGIVSGVDGRLDSLGGSVTELTGTITNLIGSIPGARRALRQTSA